MYLVYILSKQFQFVDEKLALTTYNWNRQYNTTDCKTSDRFVSCDDCKWVSLYYIFYARPLDLWLNICVVVFNGVSQ